MASSSSSSSDPPSPRAGVIRVFVASLGDEDGDVTEAAFFALRDNARWNSLLILDCCTTTLRSARRRSGQLGSHHASMFRIMAHTVLVMDEQDLDAGLMRKIAKLALLEMTSSKDINSDWQKAASGLLVAIGSRLPDLMMDEAFLQLGGSVVSISAVVQTLSEYARAEASQFAPRAKGVLSHVLPVLGGIKDAQRPVFASAFKCWCCAIRQHYDEIPTAISLDSETIAFIDSAFELFLETWVSSWDLKVRLATIEALGQMTHLVPNMRLKAALPRLLPAMLNVYKKEKENTFSVSQSLHLLLDASLKPHTGKSLLEFQGTIMVLNALLPTPSTYLKNGNGSSSSLVLRNLNEVLRCFLTIGQAFPDEFFTFLVNRITAKEETTRIGAMSVFRHLLPRLSGTWIGRKSELIDVVKLVLYEKDLNARKALAELVLALASSGWVESSDGESFVEFLVKQCAIDDKVVEEYNLQEEAMNRAVGLKPKESLKRELKFGAVSPLELRAMCDKGLLLLANTMPEMEFILWPFLLRLLLPACYTGAVATVCKCISDIARRRVAAGRAIAVEDHSHSVTPKPEELLARLLVLLQNPIGREQLGLRILTVLFYLRPLFPKSVALLWEDEIPKMMSYISDTDDTKADSWQQAPWSDMIVHLLAESLDVIRNTEWTVSLGNTFASQYDLYKDDHLHSAILHRCLGILLQKVNDRRFVREKLSLMYRRADIRNITNRLGLAMGVGLVAAEHLDTVLEELKKILESQNRNKFQRFFSLFLDQGKKPDVDDVYAALALMYGYAATYAPSTVIEARIDALVGTNVLSGLLDVRNATAKQAVLTAINLLGQAVINAAANGVCFPLKRRDQMLNYVLTLMIGQDGSTFDSEVLNTQILALDACTTLVSVEPKLTAITRDLVLEGTLGFFSLPEEPSSTIDCLISKLVSLLRSILLTSGEDGRSRADQLQHLLRSIDPYVSSRNQCERLRACSAVLELLREFRSIYSTGNTTSYIRTYRVQSAGGATLLPFRESLSCGERFMAYLPRCADDSSEIRRCSTQILDMLFSIVLALPNPVGSTAAEDREASYAALSALEELIAETDWGCCPKDEDGVLLHTMDSVGNLLTAEELVAALGACVSAICDKVRSSALGSLKVIKQLICKRGGELHDEDTAGTTQALLSASAIVGDTIIRHEILTTVCCLAQYTQSHVVFSELLRAAERDVINKDVSRFRGGWSIQEAFVVISQDELLALAFLDYVISVINQAQSQDNFGKSDRTDVSLQASSQLLQAALVALSCFFRKSAVSRRAIDQRYAAVLCALLLQFGYWRGIYGFDMHPLRNVVKTFAEFCECSGDKEMGKVLAQDGETLLAGEEWTTFISQIANCVAKVRYKEVENVCSLLWKALKRTNNSQREVAAATLSEYVHYCNGESILLNQLVGSLISHIGDESPVVRRLCVKGLVEIPRIVMPRYASQVLSVIIALIEDPKEDVALTAVQGLNMVLEAATEETVGPVLLNLCVRLRNLQIRQNMNIRAAAFGSLGMLTQFGSGIHREAFLEQVHASLPRLVFHMNDEASLVRQACKITFKNMFTLLTSETNSSIIKLRTFYSESRCDYEDFLKDFAKYLTGFFLERMDSYITSAIQSFDSSWPEIQAAAAYFAGCLLSQLVNHRLLTLYLPQVFNALIKMASNSQSGIVRAASTKSLSLLLNSTDV